MKRCMAILVAALLAAALLTGCKSSGVAQNFTHMIEDYGPALETSTGGPAEIVKLDSPDFSADLGFKLTSYPNDKALTPYKFFAINKRFGQVEYKTSDARLLVLRVSHTSGKPLSNTYHESHLRERETRTIDGLAVSLGLSADGCALIQWRSGEHQYILHSGKSQGLPPAAEIERMVKELAG